jgi:sugar O-acyltransferase (sialic acid O-acetyltransferase NeuD family)
LCVLGAGGHGRVVADAAAASGAWTRVGASDRDASRCSGELLPGIALSPLNAALAQSDAVHVAIGDAQAREREVKALRDGVLASIVHPRASVSPHAQVGAGCFIAAQAVVAPRASLGISVIVNHGAVVDHDVSVGDFSHIAPLVALGGGVKIGRAVLVGSGASVLPGRRIADGVVVGSGAVVAEDLDAPGVYAGVPARRVR